MSDDHARLLGDAGPDDPLLVDIAKLINRAETLHLIGHEDVTSLSPLIGALVAEIAYAARTLASSRLAGRLDPPLTMLLDEAALVCPVPLDRWTADTGGRGVTIHISVQSLAQLRQRWGEPGAGTILGNVACFLVFGGSPAAADLRDISLLTGEHRMRVVGADHDHVDTTSDGELRGEYRWVPVLSPAQLRALEPGQVVVMRRGLHVAVGWAPKVTDRRRWRQVPLIENTPRADVPTAAELEALVATDQKRPLVRLLRGLEAIEAWLDGRPLRVSFLDRLFAWPRSRRRVIDVRTSEADAAATSSPDDSREDGRTRRYTADPDALAAALAARVDRLERDTGQAATDLASLGRGVAQLTAQIRLLVGADATTDGSGDAVMVEDYAKGQPDWLTVTDVETARAWLIDLTDWSSSVLPGHGLTVAAPCWPVHPRSLPCSWR